MKNNDFNAYDYGDKHNKYIKITITLLVFVALIVSIALWLENKKGSPIETKSVEIKDNAEDFEKVEQPSVGGIINSKEGVCFNKEDLINGICVKKLNCANISCGELEDCVNAKCVQKKDLISILNSYESLSKVREELISMKIVDKNTKSETSGYEVLMRLIIEKKYNPQIYTNNKGNFLNSFFSEYELPQKGSKLFIINIATGLWAEAYGNLGWSLRDYSKNEIDSLFIQNDSLNDDSANATIGRPRVPNMPNTELQLSLYLPAQIVEDAHFKQYNLAMKLAGGARNQKEAAENILLWGEKNFFHPVDEPGNSWTWSVYLDNRKVDPKQVSPETSFPLSIERIYDERVVGCQEPTVFLEGIFHNLNIPAVRLWVWRHGVLYLPTLNKYIHGDSVVGGKWPKGMWLLSPEQLRPTALTESEFLRPMAKIYDDLGYPFALGMIRKNKELYVSSPLWVEPPKNCIKPTDVQWQEMTKDFLEYDLKFNSVTCMAEGKSQPILSLERLND